VKWYWILYLAIGTVWVYIIMYSVSYLYKKQDKQLPVMWASLVCLISGYIWPITVPLSIAYLFGLKKAENEK